MEKNLNAIHMGSSTDIDAAIQKEYDIIQYLDDAVNPPLLYYYTIVLVRD
jgi:hypothetical protein